MAATTTGGAGATATTSTADRVLEQIVRTVKRRHLIRESRMPTEFPKAQPTILLRITIRKPKGHMPM